MIPSPPGKHRLEACTSRFAHQLDRTRAYLDVVAPAIGSQAEADQNRQYCFQTIVLMIHTFMEEHYRLLVSLATLWRPDDVRRYLAPRRHEQAAEIEETAAFALMKIARREVTFRDKGKKLKGIFGLLFQVGPFADLDAESKCFELIRVRNIITHQGGSLEGDDLTQFSSPEVVVRGQTAGSLVFHHLDIQPAFFTSVVGALGRSVAAIDQSLKQDPRYSL